MHAYADRITVRQDGGIIASHERCFGREQTVYDPWHYVPVLARKPGAMRNGAPFKDWVLPGALGRVRQKLKSAPDGDRQMVRILSAALTDGLSAVDAACAEALEAGLCSSDVVLNALSAAPARPGAADHRSGGADPAPAAARRLRPLRHAEETGIWNVMRSWR